MAKLHGNAKLVKDFRIDVDDGRTHAVCLDLEPPEGTDMGPSALELALMSYAGCYATIFVLTAKKMRVSLKDLEVKSEAVKSQEAGTIAEVSFDVSVKADVSEDRIRRIHEVTLKTCAVGKIFDKAGVKSSFRVNTAKE